jgi:hypothetical protein
LHIDHLVPLERSNIAMLLGSSGVVKRVKIPFKNVCEILTHSSYGGTLMGLAHLQRGRRFGWWFWFVADLG